MSKRKKIKAYNFFKNYKKTWKWNLKYRFNYLLKIWKHMKISNLNKYEKLIDILIIDLKKEQALLNHYKFWNEKNK